MRGLPLLYRKPDTKSILRLVPRFAKLGIDIVPDM